LAGAEKIVSEWRAADANREPSWKMLQRCGLARQDEQEAILHWQKALGL